MFNDLKASSRVYYPQSNIFKLFARPIYNPSVRATYLAIKISKSHGIRYWIFRNLLISLHSIDIGKGASIGAIKFPHAINIVIGKGCRVGQNVTIFHNVTLGSIRDFYPTIGDDSVISPHSIILGNVEVPTASFLKAGSFIAEK